MSKGGEGKGYRGKKGKGKRGKHGSASLSLLLPSLEPFSEKGKRGGKDLPRKKEKDKGGKVLHDDDLLLPRKRKKEEAIGKEKEGRRTEGPTWITPFTFPIQTNTIAWNASEKKAGEGVTKRKRKYGSCWIQYPSSLGGQRRERKKSLWGGKRRKRAGPLSSISPLRVAHFSFFPAQGEGRKIGGKGERNRRPFPRLMIRPTHSEFKERRKEEYTPRKRGGGWKKKRK